MIEIAKKIFILKTNNTQIQFFRYLFVGGFSALIDIGSLFIMTSILHINYLISAAKIRIFNLRNIS